MINNNANCHIAVCGDFNVDFTRKWLHTVLLDSFCDNLNITPVYRHHKYKVDYTYNFNMVRFNTLDHFLLSGTLYMNCVQDVSVSHDIDNLSDHDPIFAKLFLNKQYVNLTSKVHSSRASWKKATVADLDNYRAVLGKNLDCVDIPTSVLTCHDMSCCIIVVITMHLMITWQLLQMLVPMPV